MLRLAFKSLPATTRPARRPGRGHRRAAGSSSCWFRSARSPCDRRVQVPHLARAGLVTPSDRCRDFPKRLDDGWCDGGGAAERAGACDRLPTSGMWPAQGGRGDRSSRRAYGRELGRPCAENPLRAARGHQAPPTPSLPSRPPAQVEIGGCPDSQLQAGAGRRGRGYQAAERAMPGGPRRSCLRALR